MDLTPAEQEPGLAKSPSGGDGGEGEGPAPAIPQGMTYIIAIGIDQYNYHDPSVLHNFPYNNCKKDCDDLVATLTSAYANCRLYKDILKDDQAVIKAINGRISEFLKDPACNNVDNNLILFFSGHGHQFISAGVPKGAWVPYGCEDIKDDDQLIRLDNLFNKLSGVETRNFLFLSDSCKSGRIFDQIKPGLETANTRGAASERSSVAIVSSRSNEDSKAGGPGENSKFTAALLDIFRQNMDQYLLVTTIAAKLDQVFAQETDQKPYWGKLTFQGVNNDGNFALRANVNLQAIAKREAFLRGGLSTFNYTKQEPCWSGFEPTQKKAIVLLSGTPNCGLNHLSKRARSYQDFPATRPRLLKAAPLSSGGIGTDEWLLQLFNVLPEGHFSKLSDLRAGIRLARKTESLVFEFCFYQEQGAEDELRPGDKKKCIDLLVAFLNSIPDEPADKFLGVFVLDQGRCDFEELYKQAPIPGIPAIVTPIVDALQFAEARTWYLGFRNTLIAGDEGRQAEFDSLLKPVVFDKLQLIITETAGFPGSLARKICREAQCVDLAEALLY